MNGSPSFCRQADDQLRAQGIALESLVENLNEGVYLDGRLMLYDDDPAQLERGMCALGEIEERVRKGALKVRTLDSQRDQIDLSNLSDFPRQKAELRQQRRTLAHITERLTDQLDRDAQVLKAFRELVGRMGTQLNLATLMHDALVAIKESDAEASRPRRAQEAPAAPQAEPAAAATPRSVLTEIKDAIFTGIEDVLAAEAAVSDAEAARVRAEESAFGEAAVVIFTEVASMIETRAARFQREGMWPFSRSSS
jgi:hypothetical protein